MDIESPAPSYRGPRFRYEPSPAHKDHTTEAGPPRWIPDKEKCPADMTVEERERLLRQSLPKDDQPETPRRYAVRRTPAGPEFYESKLTRVVPDGTIVVHGHPTRRVPPSVLRRMRDQGILTSAEYERFRKEYELMRFGDSRKIALDIDPIAPSWERRTPSDQGPWGRLAIWVCHENLCLNWRPSTHEVQEGVHVPLAPIADWLVQNARAIAYQESAPEFPTDVDLPRALDDWRLAAPSRGIDEESWDDRRFEWSERHFLHAGADGSWLPNLAFVKVDDALWVSAGPARFATPGAPVFLHETKTSSVPWQEALRVFSEFVDYVGRLLTEAGLTEPFPWSSQRPAFERALEVDLFEYLALGRGLRRQEIEACFQVSSPDELRRKLDLPPDAPPSGSATLQAMRDLELEDGVVEIALRCDRETRANGQGRFREWRLRALEAAPGSSPEDQGHVAARLIRNGLGLNSEPLREEILSEHLEIVVENRPDVRTFHDHSIVGGHTGGFGKVILLGSHQIQKSWARRMELARGVGHLLLDAGPEARAVGAGSSTRAIGPRRRRSGAFAAELLLPQDAIRHRSGGILDEAARPEVFESLMADYGVGAQTAAWQCYNAGLLSSREVVSDLIATYGAQRA